MMDTEVLIAQLVQERDEARISRDRALVAGTRELERRRLAELEIVRLQKILATPTLLHGIPFEYDPTPYEPGEHKVIARTGVGRREGKSE